MSKSFPVIVQSVLGEIDKHVNSRCCKSITNQVCVEEMEGPPAKEGPWAAASGLDWRRPSFGKLAW